MLAKDYCLLVYTWGPFVPAVGKSSILLMLTKGERGPVATARSPQGLSRLEIRHIFLLSDLIIQRMIRGSQSMEVLDKS